MIRASSSMPRRSALWCGMVAPIVLVATFLVEGARRTGYDAVRHQVSLLSLGEGGRVQIASFLVTGGLLVAFALGLRPLLAGRVAAVATPAGIAASGIGLVIAGVFSTVPSFGYPPGAPEGLPKDLPPSAYIHVVGALLFFLGMVTASVAFARRLRRSGEVQWATYSLVTGVVVFVFFGLSGGGPGGDLLFPAAAGLLQRIAITAGLAWVFAIAVSEIRSPSSNED